jgi:protein-disulfide isomerase
MAQPGCCTSTNSKKAIEMMNPVRSVFWRMLVVLAALLVSALALTACAQPVLPLVATPGAEAPVTEAAVTEAAPEEAAGEAATDEAATDEAATDEAAATASAVAAVAAAAAEVTGEWDGIPVGFTADGFPFRGEPDAPITMIEFSDFECPFCARYFVQTEPAINESYVQTGKLRVIFRDFPLVELHPNAPAAHKASLCVAEQGAQQYWEMHAKLFQTQTEWSNSIDPLPVFERLAEEAGADAAAYAECIADADATKQPIIDAGLADGATAGVSGTPTFIFVGEDGIPYPLVGAQPYDQFALYIDSMMLGDKPPVPEEEAPAADAPQEIPFWATAEGWLPDPDRPGFNMAGDEYRGDTSAQITVIEFSDFQCPYCQQHVLETQDALDKQYVDSGQILWVFKHFPLNIHPQAPAAGAAAECAADQGKFWEMHAALFADQARWSLEDPTPVFEEMAAEIGLDADAFSACLAAGDAAARVASDMNDGAPFVQGTPTFIVLANGQGQIIPGALPLETFQQVLDEVVAQVQGASGEAAPADAATPEATATPES